MDGWFNTQYCASCCLYLPVFMCWSLYEATPTLSILQQGAVFGQADEKSALKEALSTSYLFRSIVYQAEFLLFSKMKTMIKTPCCP